MFSGIVEEAGTVTRLKEENGNLHLSLTCSFAQELGIDQSLAHNGVCLTVVDLFEGPDAEGKVCSQYTVTAVKETLERSNLGLLRVGDKVNLERSMRVNGRLDGHIVQGHVDRTAVCTDLVETDGSWRYTFEYIFDEEMARQGYMTVEKGSVCVNGVSLTVCDSHEDRFSVAIIPYTHDHTNFAQIEVGTLVNLEFDIVGKYLSRMMQFVK